MNQRTPTIDDRLIARIRPDGIPIMHQRWESLLFMHWRISAEALSVLVPPSLAIDTYDGDAWITISPFDVKNSRPSFLPPLPWVGDFHELNVRTYVHVEGVPGIWFFSLDAASMAAVLGARTFFSLPYYNARMSLDREGDVIDYTSTRMEGEGQIAEFHATWEIGAELPQAAPGTLEFFLVERYALYAQNQGMLYRSRVHHKPWPLQVANLSLYESSMIEAAGLPTPKGEPIVTCGGPVEVEVWPLEQVVG